MENITDEEQRERVLRHHRRLETANLRARRRPLRLEDFDVLDVVGRGVSGEVCVCREKGAKGKVYAMKKLSKAEMVRRGHVGHVHSECDVMGQNGEHTEWSVKLHATFQDEDTLYLLMDYVPGGDLMSLLEARDVLDEEAARFYAAELVAAVGALHRAGCAHRDVKPDNVLIGTDGHLKLADFGLARRTVSTLKVRKRERPLNVCAAT